MAFLDFSKVDLGNTPTKQAPAPFEPLTSSFGGVSPDMGRSGGNMAPPPTNTPGPTLLQPLGSGGTGGIAPQPKPAPVQTTPPAPVYTAPSPPQPNLIYGPVADVAQSGGNMAPQQPVSPPVPPQATFTNPTPPTNTPNLIYGNVTGDSMRVGGNMYQPPNLIYGPANNTARFGGNPLPPSNGLFTRITQGGGNNNDFMSALARLFPSRFSGGV